MIRTRTGWSSLWRHKSAKMHFVSSTYLYFNDAIVTETIYMRYGVEWLDCGKIMIWKPCGRSLSWGSLIYCSGIYQEMLRKSQKYLSQNCRCPVWNSKRAPCKPKSVALLRDWSCSIISFVVIKMTDWLTDFIEQSLVVASLVRKLPTFYGLQVFVVTFFEEKARYLCNTAELMPLMHLSVDRTRNGRGRQTSVSVSESKSRMTSLAVPNSRPAHFA